VPTTTKGITSPASTADTRLWVHLQTLAEDVDTELDDYAPLASPALTGNPTAPTQAASNNSTRVATTAYVDTADALKAPLASPTLTGTPAAPTAAADTNTTQVATTAFVIGQAGANTPQANGTAAVGTSKKYSREDHVHAAGSAGATYYIKSADETVSASTTLQNDDHFAASLSAAGTYHVQIRALLDFPTGGYFKHDFTYSGTVTSATRTWLYVLGASSPYPAFGAGALDITTALATATGNPGVGPLTIDLIIVVSTSGTLQFRWAQVSASGSTVLRARSVMSVLKIA
jgi:hypothetical protein